MALKKCATCEKDLATTAETCPHCGAPGPRKKPTVSGKETAIGCGVLLLAVVCIYLLLPGIQCAARPEETVEATIKRAEDRQAREALLEDAKPFIEQAIKSGLIKKIAAERRRIWVDPLIWRLMNRDTKEGFLKVGGIYCATLMGNSHARVIVKSYQDDTVLGQYGLLGAEIYK